MPFFFSLLDCQKKNGDFFIYKDGRLIKLALFKVFRGTSDRLPAKMVDGYAYFTTDDGKFYIDFKDADGMLRRKAVTSGAEANIDTTENWNSQSNLISKKGSFYIYTDYYKKDNRDIPGLKIGDGKAYLIDLPFVNPDLSSYNSHIANKDIHTSAVEKESWNKKITCTDPVKGSELLKFSY